MKNSVSFLLFLAFAGAVSAGLPRKAPPGWATNLVTHSPFTSPAVISEPDVDKTLDEYALLGVSPLGDDNYRVTLVKKSAPGERIFLDSNEPSGGFTILGIDRTLGNPRATTVRLQLGKHAGAVGFDPQLVAIAAKVKPAAEKPAAPDTNPKSSRLRALPPKP